MNRNYILDKGKPLNDRTGGCADAGVMRSIACLIILFVAMALIYHLLGKGQATEEFTVYIAFFGGSLVMFTILFVWNFIRNQPIRSNDFVITKDGTHDYNLGQTGDGLPTLGTSLTWWRCYIYLESAKPITINNLLLRLKGKTYNSYGFARFRLGGRPGNYMRFHYFAIPTKIKFNHDTVEIIVETPKDDFGSGKIVIRD